MEHLKKPIWLLLTFLAPLVLLIYLFNETYNIIESLLSTDQKNLWFRFGYYYSILGIASLIYSVVLFVQKKGINLATSWIILLVSILNITFFFFLIDEVLPRETPNWMFTSSDLSIYPYSFLVPGALYSIILLVIHYTPVPKKETLT